jgi:hypothetical protein
MGTLGTRDHGYIRQERAVGHLELIGFDSVFWVRFSSPQCWNSAFALLWFLLLLGMLRQHRRPKRGTTWYQAIDRMANRNREVRSNSGGFGGSSSSLSSTGPVAPSPWHPPWSCPLGLAPGPFQNEPSSSNPHVHPTLPPSQPQSTPLISNNHCEECSRLLDTILILHSLKITLHK